MISPEFPRGAAAATLVALAFGAATTAQAGSNGIYKWTDSNGVVHYTNVKNDEQLSGPGGVTERSAVNTEPSNTPGGPAAGASPAAAGAAPSGRGGTRQIAIFKYRDAKGILHYTDQRPRSSQTYTVLSLYCPACDPHSKVNWGETRLNLTAFADEIERNAKQFGVDPSFVRAVIHAESAFNPDAESQKGAMGLMQLMPETAGQYGVRNAYSAPENIRAGVQHLAYLMKLYNGDERLTAAAYNAGEGAVKKYNGVPPYDETRVYVDRVGVLTTRYKRGS